MKTKDIAKNYGIDVVAFENWLKHSKYEMKTGMMGGLSLEDTQPVDQIVKEYKQFLAQEEQADQDKRRALASMLITSGFNFDGYRITKYSGYISGDDAVQVNRPTQGWLGMSSNVGGDLLDALVRIRRNALAELKEAAYALGCNAVIGVDFDYLTLDPETASPGGGTLYLPFLFAVTANGNAVVIEKTS